MAKDTQPVEIVAGSASIGTVTLTGSNVAEGIANMVLNQKGTLLASAARTATGSAPDQVNYNAKGILLTLDVTVASGTGGLKIVLNYIDPVTGKYMEIFLATTGIVAIGTYAYLIYPGVSGTASGLKESISRALPRGWRAYIAHSDASSYTYSLGYSLIL